MNLRLFDTRTNQVIPFRLRSDTVNMYVCGPTAYSPPHIGHARSYVFFDTFAKYLRYSGLKVKYVQNITDMGKNIKRKAEEMGCTTREVVDQFEKDYFEAMKLLNVNSVDVYERSSTNIDHVISQIDRMLERDHAYITKDGVFFDTSKQPDFGAISNKQRYELEPVGQHLQKKDGLDFSLWDSDPSWGVAFQSKYGPGKSHWHIQDTAIAEKYFQDTVYDIHGAGTDCIYPHHESLRVILKSLSSEIEPVQFWIHNGLVNINGEKMSKSLDNSTSVDYILRRYRPSVLRIALLAINYRTPIEFEDIHFDIWDKRIHGLSLLVDELSKTKIKEKIRTEYGLFEPYSERFTRAMNDNMNVPCAIDVMFSFVDEVRVRIKDRALPNNNAQQAYSLLHQFDHIIGLGQLNRGNRDGK